MSHVAADFHTQASNAAHAKSSRQGHSAHKAQSGQFDDLLNAIPDAPPEPRERRAAAERPQGSETRTARSERPERGERPAKSEKRTDSAPEAPATREPEAKEAAPAKDETATATETKPAETAAPAEATATDTKTAETETVDTSAAAQTAVNTLVPQATVIDPAALAPAADVSLDGEEAKTGGGKTDAAAITPASTKTAEQQALVLADQTTGLSADDAEVLSALAVTAAKTVKNGQGDKATAKTDGDKPAQTGKPAGETAAPAVTGLPAQTPGGESGTPADKPVQSELAKVGADHQHAKSETSAKPGAEPAAAAAPVNTAAIKTPDTFATHLMSPTLHTAQAASVANPAQASNGDKPVAIADVGIEITARITSGKNQFDIRLDPEELGRIHVRVNVDREGNISTHMMADRPETLDLLRRDTQGLERALQDAGLKTSDNGMQFSLRDQAQQQQNQNQNEGQASRRQAEEDTTTTLTTTVIARDYGRLGARPSGLDIRV